MCGLPSLHYYGGPIHPMLLRAASMRRMQSPSPKLPYMPKREPERREGR